MNDFNVDSIYPAKEILKTCIDLSWPDERLAQLIPSAQPEIIRCKDCKCFDRHTDILKIYQTDGYCMDWARDTYEDWYCSRAERKTDE